MAKRISGQSGLSCINVWPARRLFKPKRLKHWNNTTREMSTLHPRKRSSLRFWWRHGDGSSRIPPSTSRELTDLIYRILKRNPKERIDYEDFFNHPFLTKSNESLRERTRFGTTIILDQPIPIVSGRTQTSSMSIISSSPLREGILSQVQDLVSSVTLISGGKSPFVHLGRRHASQLQSTDWSHSWIRTRCCSTSFADSCARHTCEPSFSIVYFREQCQSILQQTLLQSSGNIGDQAGWFRSDSRTCRHRQESAGWSTHIIRSIVPRQTSDQRATPNIVRRNSVRHLLFTSGDTIIPCRRSSKETSSSRPDNLALTAIENTATAKDNRAAGVTQPIPVPSQVHNFEKMQESRDRTKSVGGVSAGSPTGSPYDGRFELLVKSPISNDVTRSRSSHLVGSSASSQYCFVELWLGQLDQSTRCPIHHGWSSCSGKSI